jgi:signal transduction histidine kinase
MPPSAETRRPRPRSIATRWTVRYALLVLVAITALGVGLYRRIVASASEDAHLLLQLEADELLEEMRRHTGESAEDFARMIAPDVASAHPDLKFTVQIFDRAGGLVYATGLPEASELPLPAALRDREAGRLLREENLGHAYPYWVYTVRADEGEYVQVSIYGRVFVRNAKRTRTAFLAALPLAVLAATGVGYAVSRASLRPVTGIVASAQAISSENLGHRIPRTGSGDEFDRIAEAFNGVLDRVERTVDGLRRFTADAAHQLRTPLTALRGRIEVTLATEPVKADQRRLLGDLLAHVAHLSGVVDSLLDLARLEGGLDPEQCEDVDLGPLLDSVVDFLGPGAGETGIDVRRGGESGLAVRGDPNGLAQLFLNLVENAVRYTPPPGSVDITLESAPSEALVRICDTGSGIPPEEIGRIFDRFHRGSAAAERAGSGLGLAVARELAAVHGGRIEVESAVGRGSTFTVRLPRAEAGGYAR